MAIKITKNTLTSGKEVIVVRSPFHPQFVAGARKLNAKFLGKPTDDWQFDIRDLDAIKDLCRKVYGTTGSDNVELVDIRYEFRESNQSHFAYGREIAYRPSRDARVRLGDGVIIVDGAFSPSAGSHANPRLMGSYDSAVTVEIRDVPIILLDENCTIVRRPSLEAPLEPKRPFEGLSDQELTEMITALQAEYDFRHPPQSMYLNDYTLYLSEDEEGYLWLGRDAIWFAVDGNAGEFETQCYDYQNPAAIVAANKDDYIAGVTYATTPQGKIVASFDGETIKVLGPLGPSAQRYIGDGPTEPPDLENDPCIRCGKPIDHSENTMLCSDCIDAAS